MRARGVSTPAFSFWIELTIFLIAQYRYRRLSNL
jgi:hypothetical protein